MEKSWAAAGVKCVCVRDNWAFLGWIAKCPEFMKTYTIREAYFVDREDSGHRVKIRLVEHPDMEVNGGSFGWCACGFEPVPDVKDESEQSGKSPLEEIIGRRFKVSVKGGRVKKLEPVE